MKRSYDNTKRTVQKAQTTAKIIAVTEQLLADKSLEEINLNEIARESGITVQTVLRHMGSREGCLRAAAEDIARRVKKQRGNTEYENIESAISVLMDHYESEGKLVLNLLSQEHGGDSFASEKIKEGRLFHRKWVKSCFEKYLSDRNKDNIDALVVATDIYSWKLLRLDLGRSRDAAEEIIINIVKKIAEVS